MKTQLITLLAILSCPLVFSACKTTVAIQNGEIPDQYLGHAKKAAGVYHGQFNGANGDLIISFSGNRPVVTFKNKNGSDILNSGCKSKVGALREADIKTSNDIPRITSALFDFDPGRCRTNVDGRSLRLDFQEQNGVILLEARIVQKSTSRSDCGWWGSHYGYGGSFDYEYRYGWDRDYPGNQSTHYHHNYCRMDKDYTYFYGHFSR